MLTVGSTTACLRLTKDGKRPVPLLKVEGSRDYKAFMQEILRDPQRSR